jgi:rod shape-determining protein MreC
MYRAADRSTFPRDTVLFLVCVTVSVAALLAPASVTLAIANSIRDTALQPLVWLQGRAEEGRTSRARLQEAVGQRDSAVMAGRMVPVLQQENESLRELLALRSQMPATGFVAAEVLHQPLPTDGRTLLLSAGSGEGVRPYQPVVALQGLVGVVTRAGASSSIANSWAHPDFRVSAVTVDGSVLGIVAPSANPDPSLTVLEFRGVAYRDTIPDGTLVVTSGLGGVFPQGIPVGRVRGVRREELGWERVYQLIPLVNPGHVSHVLLLTLPAGEAFPDSTGSDAP